MKKGRPSRAPKKLKDGYYMSITLKNTKKPIRIMRETIEEMKHNPNWKQLESKLDDYFKRNPQWKK